MDKEKGKITALDAVTAAVGRVFRFVDLVPTAGQQLVSTNAYVASVLQSGKIVGNGPGEAEIVLLRGDHALRRLRCFVDAGENRLPMLSNRYNGVDGPAGTLTVLDQPGRPPLPIEETAASAFERMCTAAREQKVWLLASSGWRSEEEQRRTIARYVELEGIELTMKRCAPPGFSDHHTGLALDVNGGVFQGGLPIEDKPAAWKWLGDNCWRFGFIIKNIPGKEHITGTRAEPWHVWYLGDVTLCRHLWEKRITLDEYLDDLPYGNGRVIQLDLREYELARYVSADSGEGFAAVLGRMARSRDTYGVPFSYYNRAQLYKFSEKSIQNMGEMLAKEAEKDNRFCQAVSKDTGRTEAQIRQDLAHFNTNPYAKVTMAQYSQWKLYRYEPTRTERLLRDLRSRKVIKNRLINALEQLIRGECKYDDIAGALDRYYKVTENTITDSEIQDHLDALERAWPGISNDRDRLRTTAVDMLVCVEVLGFLDWEYTLFELKDKPFIQRLTYVSNRYRMAKVRKVNDRRKGELFDNKILTYNMFREFYDREMLLITSDSDREAFASFCRRHPCFVRKPVNGSLGNGVALEEAHGEAEIHALFLHLRRELGTFLCEERVVAHPDLRRLNPDSVNVVRLTTYHDGTNTHILWPWQKIGRSGQLTDNAGAGGLSVGIDIHTGRLMAGAMSENGRHYTCHPDSGLPLAGYQLPNWEQALAFGRKLSERLVESMDGIRLVGWDIACREDGRWVVIEGNTFPQLLQQGAYGYGFRAELDNLIPG